MVTEAEDAEAMQTHSQAIGQIDNKYTLADEVLNPQNRRASGWKGVGRFVGRRTSRSSQRRKSYLVVPPRMN